MSTDSQNSPRAAVARYFATSQPRLRACIRSIIFHLSDVDDLLQDVAVIAIERAEKFDPRSGDVGAWVMGIARNRMRKYLEKSKRQKLKFSAELVDAILEDAQDERPSSDALDCREDCLSTLDRSKRELLIRRHSPGMTARQLAKEIGYTDTRMSRLLNATYAVLMKCVKENARVA